MTPKRRLPHPIDLDLPGADGPARGARMDEFAGHYFQLFGQTFPTPDEEERIEMDAGHSAGQCLVDKSGEKHA